MLVAPRPRYQPLGLTGYQWTVIFAAWLGWGFDIFDGLLFNFCLLYTSPSPRDS